MCLVWQRVPPSPASMESGPTDHGRDPGRGRHPAGSFSTDRHGSVRAQPERSFQSMRRLLDPASYSSIPLREPVPTPTRAIPDHCPTRSRALREPVPLDPMHRVRFGQVGRVPLTDEPVDDGLRDPCGPGRDAATGRPATAGDHLTRLRPRPNRAFVDLGHKWVAGEAHALMPRPSQRERQGERGGGGRGFSGRRRPRRW